eukprot:UN08822
MEDSSDGNNNNNSNSLNSDGNNNNTNGNNNQSAKRPQLTPQQEHILITQISHSAPSDPVLQRISLLRYIVEWLNLLCNFHPDIRSE